MKRKSKMDLPKGDNMGNLLDDRLKDFAFWQRAVGHESMISPLRNRDGCGGCGCFSCSSDSGGGLQPTNTSSSHTSDAEGCIYSLACCTLIGFTAYIHPATHDFTVRVLHDVYRGVHEGCCGEEGCLVTIKAIFQIIRSSLKSSISIMIDDPGNWLRESIQDYQKNVSPNLNKRLDVPFKCRFTPSCSEYALEAIEKYGTLKGGSMATYRLLRCNPSSKGGYDPIK